MQLIDGQNLASLVEGLRREPNGLSRTSHDPASAPTGDFPTPPAETRLDLGAQFSTLRTSGASLPAILKRNVKYCPGAKGDSGLPSTGTK